MARDTSALNTNPAGLTQIRGQAVDGFGALIHALDVAHRDEFGNDRRVSNSLVGFGGFGYAQRLGDGPLTAGIGFFAQGGAGYVYKDLSTAFGTRDQLSALYRIVKLTPGVAWQVTDALSLGASVATIYSDITERVLPGTSSFDAANPQRSFFGFQIKNARSINLGVKLGALFKAGENVTLAATYTSKTALPLEDGQLVSNMSAIGLGNVTYRDARIDGLALPREVAIGIAFRPSPPMLVSLKLNWINWAEALKTTTLRATDPDDTAAPPVLTADSTLNWRNQTVIALGMAYELDSATTLLAGYNYGRNPIPTDTTNPLLAAIAERDVTFGFSLRVDHEWKVFAGGEYPLKSKVTYTNPQLPFGSNAQERNDAIAAHLMLSRRW